MLGAEAKAVPASKREFGRLVMHRWQRSGKWNATIVLRRVGTAETHLPIDASCISGHGARVLTFSSETDVCVAVRQHQKTRRNMRLRHSSRIDGAV